MNIGLDLGSTYSILSTYRNELGQIEYLDDNGSVDIPSIVSVDDGGAMFGSYAKDRTGERGVQTYKAFKMLLMEKNEKRLKDRKYDKNHTPKWAAKEFITNLVENSKEAFGDDKIENMVVGAPDIWFEEFETLSSRAVIRDICLGIDGMQKVRVVSEPVLASAYFAYYFQKAKGKPYRGNLLIVDYGGGTLDLSLTEVKSGKDGTAAEIKMLETNGAGENTDRGIGNAGIIYMESLMKRVIKNKTPDLYDDLVDTTAFFKAVDNLEALLKNEAARIENTLKIIDLKHEKKLRTMALRRKIFCGENEYEVTFWDLVDVYNEVIAVVFDEKMEEMITWAREKHNIDVKNLYSENFRIALVGGFGKFALVRRQMMEKFGLSKGKNMGDLREDGISKSVQDRERAISYGAALVAAGEYGICSTAPHSIGIFSVDQATGKETINYMAKYHDEIDLDTPYYLQEYGEDMILQLAGDWADHFVIDHGRGDSKKIKFKAKDKFRKQFENDMEFCAMGVSFGHSDVLTLHLKEYDYFNDRFTGKVVTKDLGIVEDVFDEIK